AARPRPAELTASPPAAPAPSRAAARDRARPRAPVDVQSWPWLCEPSDEVEGDLCDVAPTVVDRQRVPAAGDLDGLRHTGISLLALERRLGDRSRHGVVVLAVDDEQRAAVGILRVDLRLGPRIQVRRRRLEERLTGAC